MKVDSIAGICLLNFDEFLEVKPQGHEAFFSFSKKLYIVVLCSNLKHQSNALL